MNKIRKGDKVIINTGKDKGKQGIVSEFINDRRVIVEGLNMVKKSTKPNHGKDEKLLQKQESSCYRCHWF